MWPWRDASELSAKADFCKLLFQVQWQAGGLPFEGLAAKPKAAGCITCLQVIS